MAFLTYSCLTLLRWHGAARPMPDLFMTERKSELGREGNRNNERIKRHNPFLQEQDVFEGCGYCASLQQSGHAQDTKDRRVRFLVAAGRGFSEQPRVVDRVLMRRIGAAHALGCLMALAEAWVEQAAPLVAQDVGRMCWSSVELACM